MKVTVLVVCITLSLGQQVLNRSRRDIDLRYLTLTYIATGNGGHDE